MLQKLKNRKNNQSGFTIIEVLIVLAIAGLIMLIVFLAVPALQRSARNTQRKNDAAAIASAIANYIDNNGGTLPTDLADDGGVATATVLDVCGTGGGTTSGTTVCTGNFETAKLGYYTPDGNISIIASTASASEASTTKIELDPGYACNTNGTTAAANASSRTMAILYATESGNASSTTTQCIEQ